MEGKKMDDLMFQKEAIQELKTLQKKSEEEDKIFFEKNNIIETQLDLYIKNILNKEENIAFTRGCTACVCIIDVLTKKIFFANAGDSRVILCKKGKAYRMSVDHKPELELENNRIKKAKGWVNDYGRINGNLNLSRTLGDLEYKNNKNLLPQEQIITAYPDVVDDKIEPDNDFIIIGCDGIWDSMQDQEICDIIIDKLKEEDDIYKVNLGSKINEKYNTTDKSNSKASKASELKIKGTTLIKIRKGKNIEYTEGKAQVIANKLAGN